MEEEIRESLEALGLSAKEMKVYIALLELGDSPVNKIVSRSSLIRVTVYPLLKSLIEKGFVSQYSMERKTHFKAISPDLLLDKIKEREDKLKLALPLIKKKIKRVDELTSVEQFKGKRGVSSFFEKIYSGEDKELWAYGNGKIIEEAIKYQSLHARKLRINKKIRLNIVVNPVETDYLNDPKYKKITNIRFNKKLDQINIYIIFGKRVAGIINLTKEISAILIRDEEVAKYHKFIFDSFK